MWLNPKHKEKYNVYKICNNRFRHYKIIMSGRQIMNLTIQHKEITRILHVLYNKANRKQLKMISSMYRELIIKLLVYFGRNNFDTDIVFSILFSVISYLWYHSLFSFQSSIPPVIFFQNISRHENRRHFYFL